MSASRTILLVVLLTAMGLLLAGWTFYEARIQQREIEQELATQAAVVARSLGPGLTAASNAAREIDEVVVWKLLDNARLLAELGISDPERHEELTHLAESNGLDTVAFFDSRGESELVVGEVPLDETRRLVIEAVTGAGDEVILDPSLEDGVEHLAVAVSRREGGVVLVQIHALEARAFTRRLGVENLLERLAGSDGILYLGYREEPEGRSFNAVWDGGELPAAEASGERLRSVRGRQVFEVEVPLESPAGSTAALRVGLDGEPLLRAAASAMRRSVLIGTVLAAFTLVVAAFALLSRLRGRERLEATQRLAEAEAARRRSERLAAAGALTAIPEGLTVTVNAENGTVYCGHVASMVDSPCARRHLLAESPFMTRLGAVMSFISALALVDPGKANFIPEGCRSHHDIIRFAHEKSIQEMFANPHHHKNKKEKELH